MVTHDCPQHVAETLFKIDKDDKSTTRNALQVMFDIHRPKYWVFGHWHESKQQSINGTRFICVDELERFTLDLDLI